MKWAEYAKMYVALAGLLASAALGVPDFPATYKLPAMLIIAAAGAFATWKTSNRDPQEFEKAYFDQ